MAPVAPTSRPRRRLPAAGCLVGLGGLALVGLQERWLPGLAQARVSELRLNKQAQGDEAPARGVQAPARGTCEAAAAAAVDVLAPARETWHKAAARGQLLKNFGARAEKVERRALAAFDGEAEDAAACQRIRNLLQERFHQEVWQVFMLHRRLLEDVVTDDMEGRMLQLMESREGPLRVQEKVEFLRASIAKYRVRVNRLLPGWAAERGDPERAAVEKRLGAVQFNIERSSDGIAVRKAWQKKRSARLMNERAHGVAVSLDPALRVMVRPEGFGNFQVFSSGPVGPPNSPAQVNLGIMNDGSIADMYREHPVPPLFALQPAVRVNLNVR